MPRSCVPLALALCLCGAAFAVDPPKADAKKTPPELGRVPFLRDYPTAVDQAKKAKKPLLVLFDEVPG